MQRIFGQRANILSSSGNLVWYGPYQGSLATLNVTQPVPELPNLYHLVFEGSIYTCTVGVFDNFVMVTDAAPHQSKLVIQWVREQLHRNVTHLLVSTASLIQAQILVVESNVMP